MGPNQIAKNHASVRICIDLDSGAAVSRDQIAGARHGASDGVSTSAAYNNGPTIGLSGGPVRTGPNEVALNQVVVPVDIDRAAKGISGDDVAGAGHRAPDNVARPSDGNTGLVGEVSWKRWVTATAMSVGPNEIADN